MKKRTTGKIHNLHEKICLQDFLASSPTDEEAALRKRLIGKTPIQAGKLIAEDFVLKFGNIGERTGWDIRLSLIGDESYFDWGELDKRVQNAHRILTQYRHSHPAAYLDRLRHILFSLPNKLRREDLPMYDTEKAKIKKEDKKIFNGEYTEPEDAARNFGICNLCWRSVPRPPRGNKILYCHQHTYGEKPSRQPEHRRRAKIKIGDPSKGRPSIDERVRALKAEILPLIRKKGLKGEDRNLYYAKLCLQPDGPLRMLAQFLRQKGITEPDCEAIGRALEDDGNIPYEHLSELNKRAWQFFFAEEIKKHFHLYCKKLFLAEAWLEGDAGRRANRQETR